MVGAPLPVVAIVGRPNVGKSTLFNRLTGSRDALVADEPGLTRDRQYGRARLGPTPYLVADTGGLSEERTGLESLVSRQAMTALQESDLALFLVDARAGLTGADQAVAQRLRATGRPVLLVVNKSDGLDRTLAAVEFHALGFGEPIAISAAHGQGIGRLVETVCQRLPETALPHAEEPAPDDIRIAVVGRPNVGKSTLVNRMLGEERVLAHDEPGTTRDSISVPFERDGQRYTLIDTAGVRRRARVEDRVERFSVIKALQAIAAAHVVVLVIDAAEGVTEQDAHLLGHVLEAGRALVVAANKWDGLAPEQRRRVKDELDRRFAFVDFARLHLISALHGSGVGELFGSIRTAWQSAFRKLPASAVTRLLQDLTAAHQPPLVRGRRIKLRYAHQGGQNPPVIVVHGNQTEAVPDSYRRYLERGFRKALGLEGTPLRLELRTGDNPYEGRRNELTPRQQRRRRRLLRHVKRG